MKGVKDVQKKSVLRNAIEAKIKCCNEKNEIIPKIVLKYHEQVDKGLGNLFREFEEANKYSNTLCLDCKEDKMFMGTFIEYVAKKITNTYWADNWKSGKAWKWEKNDDR
jgi:hypothetical protein